MNVFIYSTCQGNGIYKFLNESKEFREKYIISHTVQNYENIYYNKNFIDDSQYYQAIKNADVFIYQPLSEVYGKNGTDYIKSLLKPTCKTISIPYVYILSLWPLIYTLKRDVSNNWMNKEGNNYVRINIEAIDDLINGELNSEKILSLYDENKIDFYYEIRHRVTMNLLKNKEENIDVKTHDFIKKNIKIKRLFLYSSHPTSHIFVHMVNQILKHLDLPSINGENYPIDFAYIQSPIPIAFPTSSVDYFKFEFTTKEEENIANVFYRNIIVDYLNFRKK